MPANPPPSDPPPPEADELSPYEIEQTGEESQDDFRFTGERVFCIPGDVVDSLRARYSPSGTNLWPGPTSASHAIFTPQLIRYKRRRFPGRPGHWLVRCVYRTPSYSQAAQVAPRRGQLLIKIGGKTKHAEYGWVLSEGQEQELVIEGPDDEDPRCVWRVTDGESSFLDPYAIVVIRVSLEFVNAGLYTWRVGMINDGALPKLGAPEATIKFLGAELKEVIPSSTYGRMYVMDFEMAYKAGGWDRDGLSERFIRAPVDVPKWFAKRVRGAEGHSESVYDVEMYEDTSVTATQVLEWHKTTAGGENPDGQRPFSLHNGWTDLKWLDDYLAWL